MHIDTVNLAARPLRDPQRRTTGAARHVQQPGVGREADPREEEVLLVRRQPAVLADVLAEGHGADLRVERRGEVPVLGAVMIDFVRRLAHGISSRHPVCFVPEGDVQESVVVHSTPGAVEGA